MPRDFDVLRATPLLGAGYSMNTGTQLKHAITGVTVPPTSGYDVKGGFSVITEERSLAEKLRVDAGLSCSYGELAVGGGLDANVSVFKECTSNTYSVWAVWSMSVKGGSEVLADYTLTPHAIECATRSLEEFRVNYGDSFVDARYTGGELMMVLEFQATSETEKNELTAVVQASFNYGPFKADLNFSEESKRVFAAKRTSIRASFWIRGGGVDSLPEFNLDAIGEFFRAFPGMVKANPSIYGYRAQEYGSLLAKYGVMELQALQRSSFFTMLNKNFKDMISYKGKLDAVITAPAEFADGWDYKDLRAASDAIAAWLKAAASRAYDCSMDAKKCDLVGLSLPQVIPLPQRLVVGNPIAAKREEMLSNQEWTQLLGQVPATTSDVPLCGAQTAIAPDGALGRYLIFMDATKVPQAGIFWHPKYGCHAVFGAIFRVYNLDDGHCRSALGWPTSDTGPLGETHNSLTFDDRCTRFQGGLLWVDGETGVVSDSLPSDRSRARISPLSLEPEELKHGATIRMFHPKTGQYLAGSALNPDMTKVARDGHWFVLEGRDDGYRLRLKDLRRGDAGAVLTVADWLEYAPDPSVASTWRIMRGVGEAVFLFHKATRRFVAARLYISRGGDIGKVESCRLEWVPRDELLSSLDDCTWNLHFAASKARPDVSAPVLRAAGPVPAASGRAVGALARTAKRRRT